MGKGAHDPFTGRITCPHKITLVHGFRPQQSLVPCPRHGCVKGPVRCRWIRSAGETNRTGTRSGCLRARHQVAAGAVGVKAVRGRGDAVAEAREVVAPREGIVGGKHDGVDVYLPPPIAQPTITITECPPQLTRKRTWITCSAVSSKVYDWRNQCFS